MSRTNQMRRSVRGATNNQLAEWESTLEGLVRSVRNPLQRSSYRECLEIVRGEQQRRDHEWALATGKAGA